MSGTKESERYKKFLSQHTCSAPVNTTEEARSVASPVIQCIIDRMAIDHEPTRISTSLLPLDDKKPSVLSYSSDDDETQPLPIEEYVRHSTFQPRKIWNWIKGTPTKPTKCGVWGQFAWECVATCLIYALIGLLFMGIEYAGYSVSDYIMRCVQSWIGIPLWAQPACTYIILLIMHPVVGYVAYLVLPTQFAAAVIINSMVPSFKTWLMDLHLLTSGFRLVRLTIVMIPVLIVAAVFSVMIPNSYLHTMETINDIFAVEMPQGREVTQFESVWFGLFYWAYKNSPRYQDIMLEKSKTKVCADTSPTRFCEVRPVDYAKHMANLPTSNTSCNATVIPSRDIASIMTAAEDMCSVDALGLTTVDPTDKQAYTTMINCINLIKIKYNSELFGDTSDQNLMGVGILYLMLNKLVESYTASNLQLALLEAKLREEGPRYIHACQVRMQTEIDKNGRTMNTMSMMNGMRECMTGHFLVFDMHQYGEQGARMLRPWFQFADDIVRSIALAFNKNRIESDQIALLNKEIMFWKTMTTGAVASAAVASLAAVSGGPVAFLKLGWTIAAPVKTLVWKWVMPTPSLA